MASKRRAIKVLKFGGTSMGSAESIARVADIVCAPKQDARIAAVVVSAMSGTTDELIRIGVLAAARKTSYQRGLRKLAKRHEAVIAALVGKQNQNAAIQSLRAIIAELEEAALGIGVARDFSPAARDRIMSFGERLSACVLQALLADRGIGCDYLDTRHVIETDEAFGAAMVRTTKTNAKIRAHFARGRKRLQVVTGFIAASEAGHTTTLGRGGSDYTAAIIGAALEASAIEIWTDVSGIFTADPRVVKSARVVPELAFEEAGELAYFGAKVLHPRTILPAMERGIPVRVLNTFRPADKGTTIVSTFAERRKKSRDVEALTLFQPVTIVHIRSAEFFDSNGLMARVFDAFDSCRTSVDIIATSVAGISLTTTDETHLPQLCKALSELGEVSVERGKAVICAVGGSVNAAGIAGKMFTLLGRRGVSVEMISQAARGVSITFVVEKKDAKKALAALHKEYLG